MELNYTNNFQMDIMADEKPTSAPNLPGKYYVENVGSKLFYNVTMLCDGRV